MADSSNLSPQVSNVSDAEFEAKVLQSPSLTMVDFWAEWCGPCRLLTPTVEAVASELGGKVQVLKMNVDENPVTPSRYHIRGIPTLIIFKNGQAVDQLVGNQPKGAITDVLNKHLAR